MTSLEQTSALILMTAVLTACIACSDNGNEKEHPLSGIPQPTSNKKAPKPNTNANNMEKQSNQLLPEGPWGTTGLTLATEGDKVLITFDCANARIDQRPQLDRSGSFDVTGVFMRQRPGPQRMDDKPNEQSARFVGKVTGETLALTISLVKSGEELGKYSLEHGKEGRIRRCL